MIQNKLTITGPEAERALESIRNGKARIDFDKILPVPQFEGEWSLTGAAGYYQLRGEGIIGGYNSSALEMLWSKMSAKDRNAAQDLAAAYRRNLDRWGTYTDYHWRRDNWGTSINAMGTPDRRDGKQVIYFRSTTTVEHVVETLSRRWRGVDITMDWADVNGIRAKGMKFREGARVGVVKCATHSKELYRMVVDLWGDLAKPLFRKEGDKYIRMP